MFGRPRFPVHFAVELLGNLSPVVPRAVQEQVVNGCFDAGPRNIVQDQIAPAPPSTLVPAQRMRSDSHEREDCGVGLILWADGRFEQHRRLCRVHWFLVLRQIGAMQRLQLWEDCCHRSPNSCTSNAPAKLRRACAAYQSAPDLPRAASFSRLLASTVKHLELLDVWPLGPVWGKLATNRLCIDSRQTDIVGRIVRTHLAYPEQTRKNQAFLSDDDPEAGRCAPIRTVNTKRLVGNAHLTKPFE